MQLARLCGSVVHIESNYMTQCGKLAASNVQKVVHRQVKLLGWQHCSSAVGWS